MIIRSQNKGILLNINGVSSIYVYELTYSDTKNTVFMVKTEKCALGTYSTEEKAIKVLDMICKAYENYRGGNVYEHSIFNMPQDSEV